MTRYVTATQVHGGNDFFPNNTIIAFSDEGAILSVLDKDDVPADVTVEVYDGIICPGFVNAHCHLELSHLKGKVPEATGLVDFVLNIGKYRFSETKEAVQEAIVSESKQLLANGTVAVGDIANTDHSAVLLQQLPFHLHTFIEVMGILPADAGKRFAKGEEVSRAFKVVAKQSHAYSHSMCIVPHAPYSVSKELLKRIVTAADGTTCISVHNQESEAELLLFKNKSGDFQKLYDVLTVATSDLESDGKSSLQYVLDEDTKNLKWMLVHNTFTQQEDIDYLKQTNKNVIFCLCPNANWYIERQLPNIPMLQKSGFPICIGTDSLASNYELNIWSEIRRIQQHFPEISLTQLIQWATINGAQALGRDTLLGSFEIGKIPGINLINTDNIIVKLC